MHLPVLIFYYYSYYMYTYLFSFFALETSVLDKEEGVRVLPEGSVHVDIYREIHMYRYD